MKRTMILAAAAITILSAAGIRAEGDDQKVQTCIVERLAAAKSLAGQKITVVVKDNVPTLSGQVEDSRQKGTATRIAHSKACGAEKPINKIEAKVSSAFGKSKGGGAPATKGASKSKKLARAVEEGQ